MSMRFPTNGFCPAQAKDYCVDVEYIDVSTMKCPNRWKKTTFVCEFFSAVPGGCSAYKDCPLYDAAPTMKYL